MVLLVWVVPQFEQTFAQAGKALPLPTLVVILGTGLHGAGGGRWQRSSWLAWWIGDGWRTRRADALGCPHAAVAARRRSGDQRRRALRAHRSRRCSATA
jgi:hypothetical protein